MSIFDQPADVVEITAVLYLEKFRFGDTIIIDCDLLEGPKPDGMDDQSFSARGPVLEFDHQGTYLLSGRWTKYTNKRTGITEDQFHYTWAIQTRPLSREGIIGYIAKAGEGNGIGNVKARRIYDTFGDDAVRVLREEPEHVAARVKGVSLISAQDTSAVLKTKQHIEKSSIELMELFAGRGFPKATPQWAINKWGSKALDIVKRNPYLLMQARGIGFPLADRLYCDLGLPQKALKRQALCAWYEIASDRSGHTWVPRERAVKAIANNVGGVCADPDKALTLAIRALYLQEKWTNQDGHLSDFGQSWLAERPKAIAELRVAERAVSFSEEIPHWTNLSSRRLSEHQTDNAQKAIAGALGILGGSPGTGKTFTAAEIVSAIIKQHGEGAVAICAPTGKAAVRISEAMNEYGIPLRATTIHSLLKIDVLGSGSGEWKFVHDARNPLPYKFVIVDESSMVDTGLMRSLFDAIGRGTCCLLVGDVNQLAPVGHGAPLRDLIKADIPYGELTEIRRNSGAIVQACADMRNGQKFVAYEPAQLDEVRNLGIVEVSNPDEQTQMINAILAEFAREEGLDPVWDCQVLVPVNDKSPVSRKELNQVLQREWNHRPGVERFPFRKDDKIVNGRNTAFNSTAGHRTYVANGELGQVVEIEEKTFTVQLWDPDRTIIVPRLSSTWDLAYALSVHKSQGSEWPVVIVVIDEYGGAKMVCDRSWLYTAISRAKKYCILVGHLETAYDMIKRQKLDHRKTLLVERIWEQQASRILAEL